MCVCVCVCVCVGGCVFFIYYILGMLVWLIVQTLNPRVCFFSVYYYN